jgi:membrane associated rhomboid family serine protease
MTRAGGPEDGEMLQRASAPKPTLFSCPATTALIATNIAVFLLLPVVFKRDYPSNPLAFGAVYRFSAFPRPHEWLRLVTSSFVHIELEHLAGNMVGLWIFGRRIEKLVGSLGILVFYFGCAVIGGIIVLAIHPFSAWYGASLEVVAVAGVVLVVYGRKLLVLSKRAKCMWGLLVLFLAGSVRYEFVVKHYYPHTVGLLIGISFAVAFEFIGRPKVDAYWASRNDYRGSTQAISP